jgi:rubrerythrin
VEDSESLDSIIASIEQQIAGKQDKLVSGTNIKTINGESILGEGNIEIQGGGNTSNLATKEELANLANEIVANEEVVAAAFNDVNERINAISENVSGTTVTKEELESTVETINQTISDNKSATDTAIEGLETSIGNVDAKFANYATTESLTTEITNLTNEIIANEEVHAAALNDLNERLNNGGGSSGGSSVGAIKVYALPDIILDDLFGSPKITQESWAEVKSEIEADVPNSVFVTLMDSAFATNATAYQTLMNIAEQGESTFVLLDLGKLNMAFQCIGSDESIVPLSAVFVSSVVAVNYNNPPIHLIPYGVISAEYTSHYFPSLDLYPDGGYEWFYPLEQQ